MNRPRLIAIVILVVIGLIVVDSIPGQTRTTWVDPVSGSIRREATWLGFRSPPIVETSSLERWIIAHEGRHVPTWQFVSRTRWSIFGHPLSVGCGDSPMDLLRSGERNDRFVQGTTDDQVAEFLRVVRTGSKSEQVGVIREAHETASRSR